MILNKVQSAALSLIKEDARFLYTLVDLQKNANEITSNYIMMSQPYIGIFVDGSEQWCKKVNLTPPILSEEEQKYYSALRQGHKIYEKNYSEYSFMLNKELENSDNYFYKIRSSIEKIIGYYNVGVDLCSDEFCGNTIICEMYMPITTLGDDKANNIIKGMGIIAGKLVTYLGSSCDLAYKYNANINSLCKDYHFYNNCPLKLTTHLGFVLFSILCTINYVIVFIEQLFIDEIPQKFKFAYLQYYYLCDFIEDLNKANNTKLTLNKNLKNRAFRNNIAHYGLGTNMTEDDIINDDVLKGLTNRYFKSDYLTTKKELFKYLSDLASQIKDMILN